MFSHLAYIFDVKGLWTNFTKLAPIIRRMVILLCVAIYPFAIIGMELFAGRNVPLLAQMSPTVRLERNLRARSMATVVPFMGVVVRCHS